MTAFISSFTDAYSIIFIGFVLSAYACLSIII